MADPNDPRTKRRKALGDDPNKMTVAPQPMPGLPQGAGNMMNNPQVGGSFNQQTGSLSGVNLFPYGDGGIPLQDGRMGAVGFIGNSGQPQNLVTGQRQNSMAPYGVPQLGAPNNQMSDQMEGMYTAQQAAGRAGKLYAGQKDANPSYQIVPGLGMSGAPPEMTMQGAVPGQVPAQMPQQSGMGLPLQGMPDIAAGQTGMNTKRGGGRNQKA